MANSEYEEWTRFSERSSAELDAMRLISSSMERRPVFTLLLLPDDLDEIWIRSTIASIQRQAYPHWEVIGIDHPAARPHVKDLLAWYGATEQQFSVSSGSPDEFLGDALNQALSDARGDFFFLIDAGDILAPDALFAIAEAMQAGAAPDVIFTDEDRMEIMGERRDPIFKLFWSPDRFLSTPYVGRGCAIRTTVAREVGGFDPGAVHAEDAELLLRIGRTTDRIKHLPGVRYHRREGAALDLRLENLQDAWEQVVGQHLERHDEAARVIPGRDANALRVNRVIKGRPTVSAIVHGPKRATRLPLLADFGAKTAYPITETVIAGPAALAQAEATTISHGSVSRAANLAARDASGDLLLFVEGRSRLAPGTGPGWLTEMVGHAQREGIGAVGCRVINPDGTIRAGGCQLETRDLLVDSSLIAGELAPELPMTRAVLNPGVVSFDAMLIRADLFTEMGGFDDQTFRHALHDLDLSLRLEAAGFRNLYTPYPALRCSTAKRPPGTDEIRHAWERWWARITELSYYAASPMDPSHDGTDPKLVGTLSG